MDTLPANVVINKGLTGCGATTLAIDQERDTIIAVPYTALISNKTQQDRHKDVLLGLDGSIYSDFTPEIASYMEGHSRIKIMSTYDSLPKVCKALCILGRSPYKETHLVVDE